MQVELFKDAPTLAENQARYLCWAFALQTPNDIQPLGIPAGHLQLTQRQSKFHVWGQTLINEQLSPPYCRQTPIQERQANARFTATQTKPLPLGLALREYVHWGSKL